MSATQLLQDLRSQRIRLWVEDGQLAYDAPKTAFTPEIKARILAHKPALIRLLDANRRMDGKSETIPRHNGPAPLSFSQQRLWFLNQLDREDATYNMAQALRLSGDLDVLALSGALDKIVTRHAVLRTTFHERDNEPIQQVHPVQGCAFAVLDFSACGETPATVSRVAEAEARVPFDLAAGPLIRARLLRFQDDEHVLLVTQHHAVSDGWSISVLIREISAFYHGAVFDRPADLPALPIQYGDFSAWQRRELQGETLHRLLTYWRQRLENLPPMLDLPTDRPRPPVQSFHSNRERIALPRDLTERLRGLARTEAVSLFMTLQAAFKVLLGRLAGTKDLALGTPVAGRNRPELEGLIGFFVNTLVLRSRLNPAMPFRTFLAETRREVLADFHHQDIPFERVVEAVQPGRSLAYSPLFQVMFILQNTPMGAFQLPGLTLKPLATESGHIQFDMVVNLFETDNGLEGHLDYKSDLYDRERIHRLLDNFAVLLEAITADPDMPLRALDMLGSDERRQMLITWNETATEFPADESIVAMFERQVTRTPNLLAVRQGNTEIHYRQLNKAANRIARHLTDAGVAPEIPVGLLVKRTPAMFAAILGTLKAGGYFVPIDHQYPADRIAFMLADADITRVLTETTLVDRLPADGVGPILLEDIQPWHDDPTDEANPPARCHGQNLAYMIYTSGSTGEPKGAMIEHCGLCNTIQSDIDLFEMEPGNRVLHLVSLSFDPAVSHMFMALCAGASLHLPLGDGSNRTGDIMRTFREAHITQAAIPAPVLRALPQEPLPHLRVLGVGGDVCDADTIDYWCRDRRMLNVYGPTEATVTATIGLLTPDRDRTTVGRPIANFSAYILDSTLQPVPIGVTGELCLGGVGLARCYNARPYMTANRFVPNPFVRQAPTPGDVRADNRLYRTGDLARFLADGRIELLGRVDHQVKIRGFRVELGEIEAVLDEHPKVRESAVLVRDFNGDKRLVAYAAVVNDLKPQTLRDHLKSRLAAHMVPAYLFVEPDLPKMTNTKIDRTALGQRPLDAVLEAAHMPPENQTQKDLAAIWERLLNVCRPGIHDNFFDLGGHSLLVLQLQREIQTHLRRTLPMTDLFRFPTIAALAEALDGREASPAQRGPSATDRAQQRKQALTRRSFKRRTPRKSQ